MKVTPHTERELKEGNLLTKGVYPFQVIKAEDAISKSGNEMIKLSLRIIRTDGTDRLMFDYLLDLMKHKIKHFCDVTGLEEKYKSGSVSAKDCEGRTGFCEIIIRENDRGIENFIKDYVQKAKEELKKANEPFFNDDVPF